MTSGFSEQWAKDYMAKHGKVIKKPKLLEPMDRYRNKWERNYAQNLDLLKYIKEITDYRYEALSFWLAPNTYLRPDFLVTTPEGHMEIHEVKGHKRDKWWARFKIAREMYPYFQWRVFRLVRGHWTEVLI